MALSSAVEGRAHHYDRPMGLQLIRHYHGEGCQSGECDAIRASGYPNPDLTGAKKENMGYQQLPEAAAAVDERFVAHSAGAVVKRSQMNCL